MKTRLLVLLVVLLTSGLTLAGAALAQAPEPGISTQQPSYGPPQPDAVPAGDQAGPFAHWQPAAAAPAVNLGQPGLSFRYVRTFGETEVPYYDDPNHLCGPGGLATDGTNLWIAENMGRRALQFRNDGTYQMQIGKAGFREFGGTTLDGMYDVAVDGQGNVWVVDRAHHVVEFDSTGKRIKELGQTWNSGAANDRFSNPYGIAIDVSGNVYVSDSNNHRIQAFKNDGTYLTTIGVTGVSGSDNGHFKMPRHITIDSNNRLYVADADNHRVQIFDVSNVGAIFYQATLGVSGVSGTDNAHFNSPYGVVADTAQGRIYVADSRNWRVQIFDYTSRVYQQTLSDGSFTDDVAVDTDGNLYLAKPWSDMQVVKQFDSNLNYIRSYGTTGIAYLTDGVHYNMPGGVAIAPDGGLLIGEAEGKRLIKLDANGALQWIKGEEGRWGSDNEHFTYVDDVAVDGAGRVYATDRSNHRVQIYTPDGLYYATLAGVNGTANNQLNQPWGVAVGPDGRIYVADTANHRIQIFDNNRNYLLTLGQTGASGSDNARFNWPRDVEVDATGNIYVADQNNHRVQVFNGAGSYVRTIGVTGIAGNDFDHLRYPTAVTVDAVGHTYVADSYGGRVHIFDGSGAYLTTIGNSWGNRTGQMRDADGLAVDKAGNLYVGELTNHRVQKFAPGVPGWRQVNINGFGQLPNRISALTTFGGQLYAGAYNQSGGGAQLWRMDAGGAWAPIITNGFGITRNVGIDHMTAFNGQLYAGIWSDTVNGGEIWRSNDGQDWARVVSEGFGDPTNTEVIRLAVFSNALYAATWSRNTAHGLEIWRSSDGQNWSQVVSNGLGDVTNRVGLTMEVFNGALYAGTYSWDDATQKPAGCEVWRTADGASWTRVITDGLGSMGCYSLASMAVFQDYLYAGTGIWDSTTSTYPGGEIWRCSAASGCDEATDWTSVATKGFNNPNNYGVWALTESGSYLYAVANNFTTGMEVWRTADGTDWAQVSAGGFGDSNNAGTYWDSSIAVYSNRLYIGTTNSANGGEIWVKTLTADFTATPTRGAPPLTVAFANTSSGDFTTSLWDFGNGGTSTAISPTHTYTAAGTYTVTLTVGDGVDTNTITKTNAIRVGYASYLPMVMKNYNPYMYDDFNDPAYEGSYNHAKWLYSGPNAFQSRQQNGVLVFTNSDTPTMTGAALRLQQPIQRTAVQMRQFQARLKMSSDRTGGWASVQVFIRNPDVGGHEWYTQCYMGASSSSAPHIACNICTNATGEWTEEKFIGWVPVQYDTWYTTRIELDPITGKLCYYIDDVLLGDYLPQDVAGLISRGWFVTEVSVWNGDADTFATRYVDDVRITPAQ